MLSAGWDGVTRGRDRRRVWPRALVRGIEEMGPTYVKIGQIMAMRRDMLPAPICDQLAVLHSSVRPMTSRQLRRQLETGLVEREVRLLDESPVASGSIACVYRGALSGGREVAIKVKRPNVDHRMRTDLELFRIATKLVQNLPAMRGMPLSELVAYASEAIAGQLDFTKESANTAELARMFAHSREVRVPRVHSEVSSSTCLVLDYLKDLGEDPAAATDESARLRQTDIAMRAARKMIFEYGFVHCDLHPGNLYFDAAGTITIVDAGFCVQVTPQVSALLRDFFAALAAGDGAGCGQLMLESAAEAAGADRELFISDTAQLVTRATTADSRFDMNRFGEQVFQLQQKHGIYAKPDFAFPLVALNMFSATICRLSDSADIRGVGAPG